MVRFSIVTPSFNQAAYLSDTLESVLGQREVEVEYIVMDGGSKDGSPALIERCADRLAYWQSQPDGGQTAAINAGLTRATGDLMAFLNSDDYYLPGALRRAASLLDPARAQILYGNGIIWDAARGRAIATDVLKRRESAQLASFDYILQPSSFWTRRAWEENGPFDAEMNYVFDWEWWVRAERKGVEFLSDASIYSVAQAHGAMKTHTGGGVRDGELALVLERYVGPAAAAFFRHVAADRPKVRRARKWWRRLGQGKTLARGARWWWPELTRTLTDQQIENVLDML